MESTNGSTPTIPLDTICNENHQVVVAEVQPVAVRPIELDSERLVPLEMSSEAGRRLLRYKEGEFYHEIAGRGPPQCHRHQVGLESTPERQVRKRKVEMRTGVRLDQMSRSYPELHRVAGGVEEGPRPEGEDLRGSYEESEAHVDAPEQPWFPPSTGSREDSNIVAIRTTVPIPTILLGPERRGRFMTPWRVARRTATRRSQ